MTKTSETIKETYTIKDLPKNEQPREKLYSYGVGSLSNAELLAIVISTGNKNETAIDLARKILSIDNRGIAYLSDVSVDELLKIKGIGEGKACQIIAAIELGKRLNKRGSVDKVKVTTPAVIVDLLMNEMRYLDKEYFNIALLDTKNQILAIENVSIGTLNASIVHPRDVYRIAIKRNANSIILIHNHPSGDITPSNEDLDVTKRLVEVGNLMGIRVLDHIIIGDSKYLSFKEKNLI